MEPLFEQRIVQNSVLGSELLWHAASECSKASDQLKGVPFLAAFLVLPIALHKRTAVGLARRTSPGAIQKAMVDDRTFSAGLQKRLEAMADRTLVSLNLAFASGLLSLEPSRAQVRPARQTSPVSHVDETVSTAIGAARRVGQACAELTLQQLVTILGISF
jgi:hypothetical protein